MYFGLVYSSSVYALEKGIREKMGEGIKKILEKEWWLKEENVAYLRGIPKEFLANSHNGQTVLLPCKTIIKGYLGVTGGRWFSGICYTAMQLIIQFTEWGQYRTIYWSNIDHSLPEIHNMSFYLALWCLPFCFFCTYHSYVPCYVTVRVSLQSGVAVYVHTYLALYVGQGFDTSLYMYVVFVFKM